MSSKSDPEAGETPDDHAGEWRTPIPVDYRTMVFALLMGSLLSVPFNIWFCTFLEDPIVELPAWTQPAYCIFIVASLVLLPCWCDGALKGVPTLRRIGFGFTIFFLVLFLAFLCFPYVR